MLTRAKPVNHHTYLPMRAHRSVSGSSSPNLQRSRRRTRAHLWAVPRDSRLLVPAPPPLLAHWLPNPCPYPSAPFCAMPTSRVRCRHCAPYHAALVGWVPPRPCTSSRLDKAHPDKPHPTGSVSNPTPPASPSHESLACCVGTPVVARHDIDRSCAPFTAPTPHPPNCLPAVHVFLRTSHTSCLHCRPPPLSLVSRRVPVLYFSTTTTAMGSVSHHPCSTVRRS
jgi:hypothetical protein